VSAVPQAAPSAEPASVPVGRRVRATGFFQLLLQNPKAVAGLVIVAFFTFMALAAPLLARTNPQAMLFIPNQGPTAGHLLGTNELGEDLWSQLVWGSRTSLSIGVIAGGLTTLAAVVIGLLSGFLGGVVDEVLQLVTNVFLLIPFLPLMIVLTSYIQVKGPLPLIVVIVATGWPWGARVLRAQTLAVRDTDYVQAARVVGESSLRITMSEILPNMISLVVSIFLFSVIGAILAEAALEFLGLGNLSAVSWGTILYWAQNEQALLAGAWWWFVPPGLCIALLGTAFALINYAVDEVTNPRLRAS
jgi:peptide/nickel transport system permease protein